MSKNFLFRVLAGFSLTAGMSSCASFDAPSSMTPGLVSGPQSASEAKAHRTVPLPRAAVTCFTYLALRASFTSIPTLY